MPSTCSRYGAGSSFSKHLALDPVEIDFDLVGDAAVRERFDQRFIGVLHAGVLADNGDGHVAFRIADALVDEMPGREIGLGRVLDAEGGKHFAVQAAGVIGLGHRIDIVDVERLDHGAFAHVAEQRELLPLALRNRPVAAAKKNIGLNADGAQFAHRVLGRLGLELPGARDERHQRQMDIDRVVPRQVIAKLPNGLEIRQAFYVADGAADLAQYEIVAIIAVTDEVLDGVGDVRNDLDGGAEIVAAALLGENLLVDAAGGDVVGARRRSPGEALVMAEVEIGFGAVVGDKDLAVLVGRHRARVDIEVGIELAQPDLVAARLQQRPERRGSQTLAQ